DADQRRRRVSAPRRSRPQRADRRRRADRPRDRPPRLAHGRVRGDSARDRRPAAVDEGGCDDLGPRDRRRGRHAAAAAGAAPLRPRGLLDADPDELRGAGLSGAKFRYLTEFAERTESGEIDLARLGDLSDEDVIAELVEIKGVGRWTAEMFLIFHLGRPDVV